MAGGARAIAFRNNIIRPAGGPGLAGPCVKVLGTAIGIAAFCWHRLTWVRHMADVSLSGMDAGWRHRSQGRRDLVAEVYRRLREIDPTEAELFMRNMESAR